jgi:hypothetical protein
MGMLGRVETLWGFLEDIYKAGVLAMRRDIIIVIIDKYPLF